MLNSNISAFYKINQHKQAMQDHRPLADIWCILIRRSIIKLMTSCMLVSFSIVFDGTLYVPSKVCPAEIKKKNWVNNKYAYH